MATTELSPQVIHSTPVRMFVADHQYAVTEDANNKGAFKVVYQRGVESSFCGQPSWHWNTVRTIVNGLDRAGAEEIAAELNRAAW